MRAVLDTNIFISMILGGQVGKINEAWKAKQFRLIVSEPILSEQHANLLNVLNRRNNCNVAES